MRKKFIFNLKSEIAQCELLIKRDNGKNLFEESEASISSNEEQEFIEVPVIVGVFGSDSSYDQLNEQEEQIDKGLIGLYDAVKEFKIMQLIIGNAVSDDDELLVLLNKKTEEENYEVVQATSKVKTLISEYSKPAKICCDCILITLILAVIGLLFYLITTKFIPKNIS